MKKFLTLIVAIVGFSSAQSQDISFYEFKQQAVNEAQNYTNSKTSLLNDAVKQKKSTGLAILYSLLLPGMGELYADAYDSGVYFTIADGVLWGTYIGMNAYGNWQKDRYINYAQAKAGINSSNKDENYFATIGEYLSIDQYNEEKALERNFNEMYDRGTSFWKWNTSEERKSYRNMWVSSEQTFNDLRFVAGALIVNRVISAINAVRQVSKYNSNLSQEVGWNVSVGVQNLPDNSASYNLYFVTSF